MSRVRELSPLTTLLVGGLLPLLGGVLTWAMHERLANRQAELSEKQDAFELLEDLQLAIGPALGMAQRLSEYATIGVMDARYDSAAVDYRNAMRRLEDARPGLLARTRQLYGTPFATGLDWVIDGLRWREAVLVGLPTHLQILPRLPAEDEAAHRAQLEEWIDLGTFRDFVAEFQEQFDSMAEAAGNGDVGSGRVFPASGEADSVRALLRYGDSLRFEHLRETVLMGAYLDSLSGPR